MSETEPELPELPDPVTPVGEDRAPEQVDTSPRPEDGDQDVDQEPGFEEAESDDPEDDEDDPEVHEVG